MKSASSASVANPAACAGAGIPAGAGVEAVAFAADKSALGLPPYARPGAKSAVANNSFFIILRIHKNEEPPWAVITGECALAPADFRFGTCNYLDTCNYIELIGHEAS